MYHQFYGLREKPFSLSPDPRYLYLSDSHREALAHLLYGIEQGEGFIAITGEVGTGKTTLCRTLLQRIEPGTEVAFIFNPHLTAHELLQAICAELGLETESRTRRELMDLLNRFLLEKRRESRRVILIIDEAQNLAPDTLEQVRVLSNLETDTEKLIQIVLIGQPELDRILESPNLRQLRQRISVRWRLQPLSAHETRDYVRHRLRIAAGKPREIFSELALREVHRASRGIPRVVNLLCDRALLAGYGAEAETIGLGLVSQSHREIQQGGRRRAAPDRLGFLRHRAASLAGAVLPAALLLGLGAAAGIAWQRFGSEPAREPLPPVSAPQPPSAAAPASNAPAAASAVQGASDAAREPAPSEPPAASVPLEPPVETAALPARARPDPLEPPLDLETALARSSPGATNAAALEGLLFMWSVDHSGPEAIDLSGALESLASTGLGVLPLRNANLATLRLFNHPALLRLRAVDGVPRTVLLTRIDAGQAVLLGLQGRTALRVPVETLNEHWNGEAYVAWRDFASLPEVILPGEQGESVAWLQRRLAALGYSEVADPPTGVFDPGTASAVRSFQRSRSLGADGAVGPLTKMTLYEALDEYAMPRLVPHGGVG